MFKFFIKFTSAPWMYLWLSIMWVVIAIIMNFSRAGDFFVYEDASVRMSFGEEIYLQGGRAFSYPPFMAILTNWMAFLPNLTQSVIWMCSWLVALGVIVLSMHVTLAYILQDRFQGKARRAWFWFLVTMLSLIHVSAVMENRTHDLWVMLPVVLCVMASCRGREVCSGFFAGIAVALKATPLLFLPVMLIQRRWWAALVMLLTMISVTLSMDMAYPRHDNKLWVEVWYENFGSAGAAGTTAEAEGAWHSWNHLNQSMPGTLYRLFADRPHEQEFHDYRDGPMDVFIYVLSESQMKYTTLSIQGLIGLLMLGSILTATRIKDRQRNVALEEEDEDRLLQSAHDEEIKSRRLMLRLGEGAAVVAAMVLLSPMSSKPHFDVLMLVYTYLLAYVMFFKRDLVVWLVLIVSVMLSWLTNKDIFPKMIGDLMQAVGMITWATMLLLIGVMYLQWRLWFQIRRLKRIDPLDA